MNLIRLTLFLLSICMASSSIYATAPTQPRASPAISSKQTDEAPRPEANVAHQQPNANADQAHPSDVADSQGFVSEAVKNPKDRPCKYGEKKLDSDLCAQWYAAKGATDGAVYSLWGVVVGVVSTGLILWSLYYARRGIALAGEAVVAAKNAIMIAERANGEAARANELAAEANRVSVADFRERMRPRCVVIGITLVKDWHSFAKVGTPIPMTIKVENLGGATGRHLLIQLDQIALHDWSGQIVYEDLRVLRLAPLRTGQVRNEPLLISHGTLNQEVYGVTIRGRIGSISDQIEGTDSELRMVEEFSWRESPNHRASRNLIERAPGDGRENGKQDAGGLSPSVQALKGDV